MNDKGKQIPEWVFALRNDIPKAKQHWENVDAEGEADIRRGLESKKIARQQLQGLRYLEETFRQAFPPSVWNDQVVYSAGASLAGTVSFYEQSGRRIGKSSVGKKSNFFLRVTMLTLSCSPPQRFFHQETCFDKRANCLHAYFCKLLRSSSDFSKVGAYT